MFKKCALALAAFAMVAPSAMAANYPTAAYDASYVVTSATGKADMRMVSDGKGKLYTETSAGGQKYGTIVNYIEGTSTSLIPQGKMAMKTKLPPGGEYVADEASAKRMNGKSLGNKVIGGHPCHGFEYKTGGGTTQTWVGDDCKLCVESTTTSAAGKSVMSLKSISNKVATDVFQIPAGYKLMNQ